MQSASSGQGGKCATNSVRPRAFEPTNPETSLSVNTAARPLMLSIGGQRTARLSLRARCSLRDCLLCPAPYNTASLILLPLHPCHLYRTAISPHLSSFTLRPWTLARMDLCTPAASHSVPRRRRAQLLPGIGRSSHLRAPSRYPGHPIAQNPKTESPAVWRRRRRQAPTVSF